MVESRVRYASRRAVLTWARAEGRPPRIQASPAEGRRNRARPLRTASPVPLSIRGHFLILRIAFGRCWLRRSRFFFELLAIILRRPLSAFFALFARWFGWPNLLVSVGIGLLAPGAVALYVR